MRPAIAIQSKRLQLCATRKLRRQPRLLTCIVCLSFLLPLAALAQTNTPAPLPPEAQAAVEKGMSAVKQTDWIVAIRYFNEARQAAPDSPVPLLNLGLAESKIPGRELRAICWFEAYLALLPNGANASAVRQQLTDLDVRAEGNAQKVIGLLKAPAAKFSEYKRKDAQAKIASLLVRVGDLDAATSVLDQSNEDAKDSVRYEIVLALAKSRRFADAIKLVGQFKNNWRPECFNAIAIAQIEAGLLSDAKLSLDILAKFKDDGSHAREYYSVVLRLAETEYQSGQHEQAAALLRDAKKSIDTIAKDRDRKEFLAGLAVAEYTGGQREEGNALLHQIRDSMGNLASSTSGYGERMDLLLALARAFNQIGEREKSVQCLEEAAQTQIAGNATNEITPYTITYMYIELQDWDRAKAQASRETTDDYNKRGWSKKEKEEFAAARTRDIANANIARANASTKALSIKTLADATASPAQRAQTWCDYVNAAMNTALFTDTKTTLEGLTNPGEDDPYRDASVFGNVEEEAEILVNRLKDVRDLQAKQIKFSDSRP